MIFFNISTFSLFEYERLDDLGRWGQSQNPTN